MGPAERSAFLRFAWARARAPAAGRGGTAAALKIQTPAPEASSGNPDGPLPTAQTCFFSLSLPRYSSKEVLRAKLRLAVAEAPNMDADVRLHNADGWADV
mmetsp:Transcript_2035/g.3979  ORF Transcript_2035/g.3979 Transcript_2035/m.3979 type:complete len:100 (+) Transcript_2035:2-301(+)